MKSCNVALRLAARVSFGAPTPTNAGMPSALEEEILYGSLQILALQATLAASRKREASLTTELEELRAVGGGDDGGAVSFDVEKLHVTVAERDVEVAGLRQQLAQANASLLASAAREEEVAAERVAAIEEATKVRLLLARCHDALRQEVRWGSEQVETITGMVESNRAASAEQPAS